MSDPGPRPCLYFWPIIKPSRFKTNKRDNWTLQIHCCCGGGRLEQKVQLRQKEYCDGSFYASDGVLKGVEDQAQSGHFVSHVSLYLTLVSSNLRQKPCPEHQQDHGGRSGDPGRQDTSHLTSMERRQSGWTTLDSCENCLALGVHQCFSVWKWVVCASKSFLVFMSKRAPVMHRS